MKLETKQTSFQLLDKAEFTEHCIMNCFSDEFA